MQHGNIPCHLYTPLERAGCSRRALAIESLTDVFRPPLQDVCQALWCKVEDRCVSRMEPAAEGTQCAKHKVREGFG